ncbi:MAG: hypothetical protein A2X86_10600 [Bdellovibrionales bacterium GWA2_49_15]|nr:MAG: hypothetical protein A2X86_10600 [Bdellovibrionales bacterium GWA2_49_15]
MYFLHSNIFKLLLWTVILGSSYFYNCHQEELQVVRHAKIDALASYKKDLLYRTWSTRHGGTYVPITEKTPPNPYLAEIQERDITTPSGVKLTLINPAYMTRQVNELAKTMDMEVNSHMTSLKPIRPENAADPWETKALMAFEKGVPEVTEVVEIEHKKYLRFMRPFFVEKECLKCHAMQGYKVGDVRGGLSVNVSLQSFQHVAAITTRRFLIIHGIIWCLGIIFGLSYQRFRLKKEAEIEIINEALSEKAQEMATQYENLQHAHRQLKDMHTQHVTQTSKLASVALVATKISDEMDHLLQIIKNHCLMFKRELQREQLGGELEEIVREQESSIERVSILVKDLHKLAYPTDTDQNKVAAGEISSKLE